jgi:hypothetical protein
VVECFGFLIQGLIYFVIGWLILQLLIGAVEATASPTSAIEVLERQLLGKQLPDGITVGISGYSLWWFGEKSCVGGVRSGWRPLNTNRHGTKIYFVWLNPMLK